MRIIFAAGFSLLILSGCKKKEEPVVIEEVPAAVTTDTDTTSTLSEEPDLKEVGQTGKSGKSKGTKAVFHPSAAASGAGFSENGRFVVQVSIVKSKRQAANLVEKLANAGYPAYVAEVENPTPELAGTWQRVRIGNFSTVSAARAFGENTLSGMGYQFWVDNKKNDAVGGESAYSTPASEPTYTPANSYSPPTPSEPSTPSGESWGTPKTEEPAVPSGETWGTPASTETPASESLNSVPAATSDYPSSATPAEKSPADTGKINLDEW